MMGGRGAERMMHENRIAALVPHAAKRAMAASDLIDVLIDTIIADNMIDAILDDEDEIARVARMRRGEKS